MSTIAEMPRYMNGRPYAPLQARRAGNGNDAGYGAAMPFDLTAIPDWAAFWQRISGELERLGYAQGTRAQYRSVLRGFYRHTRQQPAAANATLLQSYLARLTEAHCSWSWIGMNISVLRNVFDKLAGRAITRSCATPKRRDSLPEVLNHQEARALLAAAPTTRDQLLLGLLYGCGLKVGELRRLTWGDVDGAASRLRVRHARGKERFLDIPPDLRPVLDYGKARCPETDSIFQGRRAGTGISARMIERVVRAARDAAGILKPVTAMTLRHAYAVHCLERGESIRAIQEALGHDSVKTTLLYERCVLPENLVSPLDRLRQRQREAAAEAQAPETTTVAAAAEADKPLFDQPLSVQAIELPFRDHSAEAPGAFYRLLKTLISGRFLGWSRLITRSG